MDIKTRNLLTSVCTHIRGHHPQRGCQAFDRPIGNLQFGFFAYPYPYPFVMKGNKCGKGEGGKVYCTVENNRKKVRASLPYTQQQR